MLSNYKYLSQKQLDGFKNYKYACEDTSPFSNYVMHPFWNFCVKFFPRSVAPNLITIVGFLFLVAVVVILTVLDLECTAAGAAKGVAKHDPLPNWLYLLCGIFLFINYNLDGIDGKQARRIGVSGPLGEMFDHGLDSFVVFLIPYSLLSAFGRDEYSISSFRAFLIILSITINWYIVYCERYNIGYMFMPWAYDISMWLSTMMFVVAGIYGPEVYKTYVYRNITFVGSAEISIHLLGSLLNLLTICVRMHRIWLEGKNKRYPITEAIRPVWSMLFVITIIITWIKVSPNNILDIQLRPFLLLFGVIFSSVASRLVITNITGGRCEVVNWMTWPLLAGLLLSIYQPHLEITILYALLALLYIGHLHFGLCVVNQTCEYFGIKCFSVPKSKK